VARQLAEETGEWEYTAQAHAAFFCAAVERAEIALSGARQRRTRDQLEQDLPNIRAALGWALQHDAALALRIATALSPFWELQGDLAEGRRLLDRALAAPSPATGAARTTALIAAAGLAEAQGDYDRALALHEAAQPLLAGLDDPRLEARALNNFGLVLESQGDYTRALTCYDRALDLYRAQGTLANVANVLNNQGGAAYALGNYALALHKHAEAQELRQQVGDDQGVIASLINLAAAYCGVGDDDRAVVLLQEALQRSRELGYLHGIASALLNLGVLAAQRGDIGAARVHTEEALRLQEQLQDAFMTAMLQGNLADFLRQEGDLDRAWNLAWASLDTRRALQDRVGIGLATLTMAGLALDQGAPEHAARLHGHARATLDDVGYELPPEERRSAETVMSALCTTLGEARCISLYEAGRAAPLESVLAGLPHPTQSAGTVYGRPL